MKIFFIASRTSSLFENYEKILEILKQQGHKVSAEWMNVPWNADANNFNAAYKRDTKAIKEADAVVTEVSEPSSGASFLIAHAFSQKKPILALYDATRSKNPPNIIRGSSESSKHILYREYNENNLGKTLNEFEKYVKSVLDTKFILIIPAEIDRYLEWGSSHKRMHKAQIVREAIENMMEKDKEWQEAQKSL